MNLWGLTRSARPCCSVTAWTLHGQMNCVRHSGTGVTVAFGIGTYIANDTCEEPLNIVMKTTACNGMDVAKISDTPGKEMCKNADYVDYLTRCIRWRLEHDR